MRQEDVRIWQQRPQGYESGGQHVGITYMDIWGEHAPTGLRAMSPVVRSQHKARGVVMAMLEYGLAEMGWIDAALAQMEGK